jgi:hypothetical protein
MRHMLLFFLSLSTDSLVLAAEEFPFAQFPSLSDSFQETPFQETPFHKMLEKHVDILHAQRSPATSAQKHYAASLFVLYRYDFARLAAILGSPNHFFNGADYTYITKTPQALAIRDAASAIACKAKHMSVTLTIAGADFLRHRTPAEELAQHELRRIEGFSTRRIRSHTFHLIPLFRFVLQSQETLEPLMERSICEFQSKEESTQVLARMYQLALKSITNTDSLEDIRAYVGKATWEKPRLANNPYIQSFQHVFGEGGLITQE